MISPESAKIGLRAKFTGRDRVFHGGQREGKVGTIVTDANGHQGSNFGADPALGLNGCCGWQLDGDPALFTTGLEDLTACD